MTLSILGIDESSGQFGVACATHGVAVGARVPAVREGVGIAVSQAMSRPCLGVGSLDEMATNAVDPAMAIERVIANDTGAADRQLALLDVYGRAAVHTGENVPGYTVGRAQPNLIVAGNMLCGEEAPKAARVAFMRDSQSPLGRRLLSALIAGDASGGDCRGVRSAVLVVASTEILAERANLNLRVDDSFEPLAELGRLLRLNDVQELLTRIYLDPELNTASLRREVEEFVTAHRNDSTVAPYIADLQFWLGIGHFRRGEKVAGRHWLKSAGDSNSAWLSLAAQMPIFGGRSPMDDSGIETQCSSQLRNEVSS